MLLNLPAEFNNLPIRLSKQGYKRPHKVLQYFFGAYYLNEIRHHLAALTEIALTKENSHYASAKERDGLLWFYYQLEAFIEAAWLIHAKKSLAAKVYWQKRREHFATLAKKDN